MLDKYGRLVKRVEGEIEDERTKQSRLLEEKLRKRRADRQKDIDTTKADREKKVNEQLQSRTEKAQ